MYGIAGAAYIPGQPEINDRLRAQKRSDDGIRRHTKGQADRKPEYKVDRRERKKVRTDA